MLGLIRPHDPGSPLTLVLIFAYAIGLVVAVGGIWLREHLKRRAARMAARHAKNLPPGDLLPYREIPLQEASDASRGAPKA